MALTVKPAAPKYVPPNYQALLQNDPTLRAALQAINAQGLQGQVALQGGAQQLFGQLGEAPDASALPPQLRGALAGIVTPELQGIIGQSNQAGLSTLAQLARQYQQGQSNTAAGLAARGLIHSGEYGAASNENLHNYTLGQYNARQNALSQLGQLGQTYLSNQNQLAGQAATATGDAQQRISDQISQGIIAPTAVAPPPRVGPPSAPHDTAGIAPPVAPRVGPAAPSRPPGPARFG